jgi:hypothetical protein
MYVQYEYFKERIDNGTIIAVKSLHRASGITELEETLSENIRGQKFPLMVVEDDGDGFLSLVTGNHDNTFFTFYILDKPDVNSSASRKEKLLLCKKTALLVLKQMISESHNFGDPCYGIDFSRVEKMRLGPVANGLYGYSFSYLMDNENFELEETEG